MRRTYIASVIILTIDQIRIRAYCYIIVLLHLMYVIILNLCVFTIFLYTYTSIYANILWFLINVNRVLIIRVGTLYIIIIFGFMFLSVFILLNFLFENVLHV